MYKVSNQNYKERIEDYLEKQHFLNHNQIDLYHIEPGITKARVDIQQFHKQQFDIVHGGVIATLADITAGFAAYTLVDKDTDVVTGEIKISYLAKGKGTNLEAVAKVIKPGRKLHFCESEVYSEGKLIAKASSTMICIERQK